MSQNCGTCKHYQEISFAEAMMDPDAVYKVCTWQPVQPFWMVPAYIDRATFGGCIVSMNAIRKPGDGAECRTWEPKT